MNPNSQNQIWSLWVWKILVRKKIPYDQVKQNCARFGRNAFGSSSQMNIQEDEHLNIKRGVYYIWTIKVRSEGHQQPDEAYVKYMKDNWDKFLRNGFGNDAVITFESKLEAGSKGDGSPASQLIIIPPVKIDL